MILSRVLAIVLFLLPVSLVGNPAGDCKTLYETTTTHQSKTVPLRYSRFDNERRVGN
ncbi:MAG: hypothetical protein M2R45_03386 [Verrucomicrobia subdivision 3 bacterium]|nr:hypothetical protein [Limisphaerales bacterium]MCS1416701.1 hypothetical protein [Limisphaerales bacterium]